MNEDMAAGLLLVALLGVGGGGIYIASRRTAPAPAAAAPPSPTPAPAGDWSSQLIGGLTGLVSTGQAIVGGIGAILGGTG